MEETENIKKTKTKKSNQKESKFKVTFAWPVVVLVTALILSFSFGSSFLIYFYR